MNTLSVTFSFNDLKNEFDQFNKEIGRAAFAVQSFMAYTISATYAESTRTTKQLGINDIASELANGKFDQVATAVSTESSISSYARMAARSDLLTKSLLPVDAVFDILANDKQSALNRSVGIYVDDSIALSAGRLTVSLASEVAEVSAAENPVTFAVLGGAAALAYSEGLGPSVRNYVAGQLDALDEAKYYATQDYNEKQLAAAVLDRLGITQAPLFDADLLDVYDPYAGISVSSGFELSANQVAPTDFAADPSSNFIDPGNFGFTSIHGSATTPTSWDYFYQDDWTYRSGSDDNSPSSSPSDPFSSGQGSHEYEVSYDNSDDSSRDAADPDSGSLGGVSYNNSGGQHNVSINTGPSYYDPGGFFPNVDGDLDDDYSDDDDDDSDDDEPIVLDLDGNGIKLTQQTSSITYFDMAGDGKQHLTAWAAAGDGVLAIDANGDGKIDQKSEIDFTAWDTTATTDMQALRDVFDTNHNGKLDAGDSRFADFKVVVTEADGTQQLKSLADLGITSIDLISNNQATEQPDGSKISGTAAFSGRTALPERPRTSRSPLTRPASSRQSRRPISQTGRRSSTRRSAALMEAFSPSASW